MIALHRAMVLAAGLGTRMRPLTDLTPKPLLRLRGRTLLDRALDRLDAAGAAGVVVNAHHLAPQVTAACEARRAPRCTVVIEDRLLDTGGGVVNALPLLGDAPFAVVNGDSVWLDGPTPALSRLAAAFDPERMDALLLLHRAAQVEGETGRGDFLLDPLGRARRPREREVAPYMFAGVQVAHPRLFRDPPPAPFSNLALWERAAADGRLWALVHDGVWFHLSTPADLALAERRLTEGLVRLF